MIKLVTIDLDGTLLNSYGVVTEYTKKIIKEAQSKGCRVVIATGRPTAFTLKLAKEAGLDRYIITGNGAILYDCQEDKIVWESILEKDKALEVARFCEENSVYYNAYTERDILAEQLAFNVLYYRKENIFKSEKERTTINIVDNIIKYVEENNINNIIKMTVCDESKAISENIIRRLREIEGIEVLDSAHMSKKIFKHGTDEVEISYNYTEISKKGTNKWTAIKELINILGIKEEEVMAIGDNVNDAEMIKNSGIGVLMENGCDYMKKDADYVTADNNNDGVGKAIAKFVLNED